MVKWYGVISWYDIVSSGFMPFGWEKIWTIMGLGDDVFVFVLFFLVFPGIDISIVPYHNPNLIEFHNTSYLHSLCPGYNVLAMYCFINQFWIC